MSIALPTPTMPLAHLRDRISEVISNRREWLRDVPSMLRLQPGCEGTSVYGWQHYEQGHIDRTYDIEDELQDGALDDLLDAASDVDYDERIENVIAYFQENLQREFGLH